jgi:glycosyltransferase involved in cell wall biosynthesis
MKIFLYIKELKEKYSMKLEKFNIIITTNNRPESVKTLVRQILKNSRLPEQIIIVDSSSNENVQIQNYEKIKYIRSSHANQPYQRYIGYLASDDSHILLYLDDDMEIADENAFEIILNKFIQNDIVGLAINFVNDNEFLNQKVPKSKFTASSGIMKGPLRLLKTFTGQVKLPDGKYWFNGLKGSQPKNGGKTEWFKGGAFAVKRELLYKGFNFKLFDLYENGLGKGEDGIIGYTLSKQGTLYFEPKILFIHNDKKDSTYTQDFFSFAKRVIYSRLYLSYEFCRLNNIEFWKASMHYHWYVFWRIIGMMINQVLDKKNARSSMLKGYFDGWVLALKTQKELQQYSDNTYWIKEAKNDIY